MIALFELQLANIGAYAIYIRIHGFMIAYALLEIRLNLSEVKHNFHFCLHQENVK